MFVISPQTKTFIFSHVEQWAGDHAEIDEVLTYCEAYLKQYPFELWAGKKPIKREWSEIQVQNLFSITCDHELSK